MTRRQKRLLPLHESPMTGAGLRFKPLTRNEIKRTIEKLMYKYEGKTSEMLPTGIDHDLVPMLTKWMLKLTYDVVHHAAQLCLVSKRKTISSEDVRTAIREHRAVTTINNNINGVKQNKR